MTLESSSSRAVFHGNNAATVFPFSFRVWNSSELKVLASHSDRDEETDVTSACTITFSEAGGTVHYAPDNTPLPAGARLAIVRNMPFVQNDRYVSGTRFDPEVIETALDVACAERQQLREILDRAVVIPPTWEGEVPLKRILDAADMSTTSARDAAASAANALQTLSSVNSAGAEWIAGIRTEGSTQCLVVATEGYSREAALKSEGETLLVALETANANALSAALRAEAAASTITGFAQNRKHIMRWELPTTGEATFHLSRSISDGTSDDVMSLANAVAWAVLPESATLSINASGHLLLSLPFSQDA